MAAAQLVPGDVIELRVGDSVRPSPLPYRPTLDPYPRSRIGYPSPLPYPPTLDPYPR